MVFRSSESARGPVGSIRYSVSLQPQSSESPIDLRVNRENNGGTPRVPYLGPFVLTEGSSRDVTRLILPVGCFNFRFILLNLIFVSSTISSKRQVSRSEFPFCYDFCECKQVVFFIR